MADTPGGKGSAGDAVIQLHPAHIPEHYVFDPDAGDTGVWYEPAEARRDEVAVLTAKVEKAEAELKSLKEALAAAKKEGK